MANSFVPRAPSRRSRLTAAVTRCTVGPVARAVPPGPLGVFTARQIVAGSLAAFGSVVPGTAVTPVRVPGGDGGQVRGEWVRAPGAGDIDGPAMLYVHGSGYVLCSPRTHRGIVSQLSRLTGLPVFSVDYRLAPRYRFPSAADDVRRAYDWLARTRPAGSLVVAGDSAGGHLAVDLCLQLRRAGAALPAAQVVFSPVADLTFGLAHHREALVRDPLATAELGRRLVGLYTAGADASDPRLTHVVATDEALPPTLIQAGGTEMLAADAHQLHRALRASGTDVRLEVWPGQMHVFQALPRAVPEAAVALRRAAEFITMHLGMNETVVPVRPPRSRPRAIMPRRKSA